MDISDQHKNDLGDQIVDEIAQAIQTEQLKEEDLPDISTFVLEKIDAAKTQEDIAKFLEELSVKWPVFKNIAIVEQGQIKEQQKDEVTQDVVELAKTGNIDQAISLAKSETKTQ